VTHELVSVVIPANTDTPYLPEAINSVLGQTHANIELLVVDDGLTDQIRSLVEPFGHAVRYVIHEDSTVGAARNEGVHQAEGDLIAFLDADDLWEPTKLEMQLEALAVDETLEIIFTSLSEFVSPVLERSEGMRAPLDRVAAPSVPSLLTRRASFDRVGSFVETPAPEEWIDWWARALEAGVRWKVLDQVLVKRRLHPGSRTARDLEYGEAYLRVLRRSIARRRREPL
jgi:glycosyltransferase involved in cell wall biosynthesis